MEPAGSGYDAQPRMTGSREGGMGCGGRMQMKILNLTQHRATPEQVAAGVQEPAEYHKNQIQELSTFDSIPTREMLIDRADQISEIVRWKYSVNAAMIGGAPFFMPHLAKSLTSKGITPLYAFSRRESVEEEQPDGSIKKLSVFRHIGFVGGSI